MWTTCFVRGDATEADCPACGRKPVRAPRASASAGGAPCSATTSKPSAFARATACRTWPRRCAVAFASMAWNTGSSSPGELEMTCSTSEVAVCCSSASARCSRASASSRARASSFSSSARVASWQRAFSPSFRSNEACDRAFGSSPLCETRSPRRHSHWSPSGQAQPRIEPVNPNRTAR